MTNRAPFPLTRTISLIAALAACASAQVQVNWLQATPSTNPPARYGHSMVYDAARRQVVLFGGVGSASPDTWVWDGANWSQKFPLNSPPALSYAAMAYDAARDQVVLFGGTNQTNGPQSATWVWDGNNWTSKTPANSPSARYDAAIAYDAIHQNVVLFGGNVSYADPASNNGTAADTWIWDGTNWIQRSPQTSPHSRYGASMTFDAARGQVVLYGGAVNLSLSIGVLSPTTLSDTWVWDGNSWSQKSPAGGPGPRVDTPLIYDSARQETFLFGGGADSPRFPRADTWAWDGVNWTQQSPANTPPPRYQTAMAYNAGTDQVVLFGGWNTDVASQPDQDTWIFHPANPPGIVLTALSNPATFGQPVLLTAVLHPLTPTGAVTFYAGTTVLGTAPIHAGLAALTTIALPAGVASVRAYYAGDVANASVFSPAILVTVQSAPATTLAASPGTTFGAGAGPFALVVADFNGDNRPDLAVANAAGSNVTVLLGDGSGGFTLAGGGQFPTGVAPFSLAVGDFNGDGNQDLAVANSGDSSITILLGDGGGGFTPAAASPFPTGSSPLSIVVADFNGDGKADVATANTGDGSVTILLGDGSGRFTAAPSLSRVRVGNCLTVGDFNGDGTPDLALASVSNLGNGVGEIKLLLGQGDGTFSSPIANNGFITGFGIVSLATGDFNGDGIPDIAAANLQSNTVTALFSTFFLADGVISGGFSTGISPESVAVGDFNGDGKLDIAVINSDSNSVIVAFGNGSYGFTPVLVSSLPASSYPFGLAIGDFNGDGRADLAVANFIGGNITVLLGGQ